MKNDYEFLFPSPEIFLNPIFATYGWDKAGTGDKAEVVMPEGGGIFFYAEKGDHAFRGFPFPPATAAAAFLSAVFSLP